MDSNTIRNFIDRVVSAYDLSDYSVFFDYVERCIDRVDLDNIFAMNIEDEAYDAVNDEMIYFEDQWELMRAHCEDPRNADLDEALEALTECVINVLDYIRQEAIAEKRDEFEEQLGDIRCKIIKLHNDSLEIQDDLDSIKYDDCFDDLCDQELFDNLEQMASEIEAFLRDYDLFSNTYEEIIEPDEDFEDDLLIDEGGDEDGNK